MSSYQFEEINWRQIIRWIVIVVLVCLLVGGITGFVVSLTQSPCWRTYSYTCKDYEVQQCLAANKYTHDECINLIGSK